MKRWLALGGVVLVAVLALILVLIGGEAPDAGRGGVPASGGAANVAISPIRSVVGVGRSSETVGYTINNSATVAKTYRVSTGELNAAGTPLPQGADNAGAWARPARTVVRVPARGAANVAVVVSVPADRGATTRRIGVSFTDDTVAKGNVAMRARITTSVYVPGTGPAVRRVGLGDLKVPHFARGDVLVRASLRNEGTTTIVPGALNDTVTGTVSRGDEFSLNGGVAGPGSTVDVIGELRDLPTACWCQVKVSTADGQGGQAVATARVLVLPWPWVWVALGLLVFVLAVVVVRRLLSRSKDAADADDTAREEEPAPV